MTTNIEWARNLDGSKGETWPVCTGCTPVSKGCRNCYAARMAATRLKHHPRYKGLAVMRAPGMPRWTGEIRLNHDVLEQPLHWRKPRMAFVASMSDLFHEDVPRGFILKVFKVMADCPQHSFQLLTKRPFPMKMFFVNNTNIHGELGSRDWHTSCPLPNVWLGVSIENQSAADERREYLRQCPAAVKFVSYEPALGPVDWTGWEFVDQIISGGESGPGARPSHPGWHRATRDFCQEHGIAYFMKQHGAWLHSTQLVSATADLGISPTTYNWPDASTSYYVGKKCAGHLLDGRTWQEFPRCS